MYNIIRHKKLSSPPTAPGFTVKLDQLEKDGYTVLSPFWHNTAVDNLFFFPLTKNYALEIVAYEKGSPLNLSLQNTPIATATADDNYVR